jgi:hypothetical protein
MTDTSRLDKIAKLLAKAEDSAATEAEREAYTDKATKLMAEWMIQDAEIQAHRSGSDPAEQIIKVVLRPTERSKRLHHALVILGTDIADAMNCKGFIQSYRNIPYEKGLVLVGYASDVARVKFLWESLQGQVIAPRETALRNADVYSYEPMTRQQKDVFRTSFIKGFGARVGVRLWIMRKEAVAEHDAANGAASVSTDLVLIDRSDKVNQWVKDEMKIGKARSHRTDFDATRAGRAAGDRASLATGALDSSTSAKALEG